MTLVEGKNLQNRTSVCFSINCNREALRRVVGIATQSLPISNGPRRDWIIVRVPGTDSRGEKQIKWAKLVRAKVCKTGWKAFPLGHENTPRLTGGPYYLL